jgi:glycosyltransferase involved in cell wall biosynthesis
LTSITTIIPTRDEQLHIERCIESALPLGRVVVVDAESNDHTRELARGKGADVFVRPWLGFAAQKNWALSNVGVTTDWILLLDADEFLDERARERVLDAVTQPDVAGFYLARRNFFLGRELKHAWWYPDHQLRLFRTGAARYEDREVHEHMVVEGPVRVLEADILHENVKGLFAFIARHNTYSNLEAREILQPTQAAIAGSFLGDHAARRRALKRVWLRLPAKPALRFVWLFFVRRGFLDGRAGFLYSALIASYDLMIEAKVVERRLIEHGELPDPGDPEARAGLPAALRDVRRAGHLPDER